MKLGINYMVFDGEELLKYAIGSIRSEVDFISVIYQKISYFGNLADQELECNLLSLKKDGLIDHLECYTPNLTDEIYQKNQLIYAKNNIGNADCSVVFLENYYKNPTYLIRPFQEKQRANQLDLHVISTAQDSTLQHMT